MSIPSLTREIVVVDSFARIAESERLPLYLNEKTLVLVDVDETLLVPKDPILSAIHQEAFDLFVNKFQLTTDPALCAPYLRIDKESVSWIQSLQEKNIHVIAFTASGGRLPMSEGGDIFPDWRSRQLRELEFTFSDPEKEIEWETDPYSKRSDIPLLKGGILYSAGRSKGKILEEYIRKTKAQFSQVVFVDDQRLNLNEVAITANRLGMHFIGIHYKGADALLARPLNMTVAGQQMEHFQKTGNWPSAES